MTNIFDWIAFRRGRAKGIYLRALKGADAPLGDPMAWNTGRYWGEGLSSLGSKTPLSKEEMVEQFTSWVYICAQTNSTAIASIPLGLYVEAAPEGKAYKTITTKSVSKPVAKYLRRQAGLKPWLVKGEGVDEVTSHPFLDLMKNVNPFMNGSDLREITSLFMDLTGEAYWYVVRNKIGVPAELWPIPSQHMTPIPGTSLKDFIKGYEYERGRVKQTLRVEDVIPFSFPNPLNPYKGMSCVRGVADAIYANSKINEYVEAMFENKARPGGVFTADYGMSQPEFDRASEELAAKYSGARKAGKNMIVPPGLKFDRDFVTPDEMAYIEGKKITREEICIAFGVPISILVSTDVNRANADAGDNSHAKRGVLPRLRKLEEKINERLLPEFDPKLFCAFDNPVQEDRTIILAENTQYVGAGIRSRNAVRAELGEEPVEGGDELLVPYNLIPLSQAVAEPEPTPPPVIVAPPAGDNKPKPGAGGDEGNLDTGETGKAAMLDELTKLVEQKIKAKLEGEEEA
jgi:HK97 family phage portal protein